MNDNGPIREPIESVFTRELASLWMHDGLKQEGRR